MLKDDTHTIDEIFIEKDLLMKSLDEMHSLALAIEAGINSSVATRRQWKEAD